MNKIKLSKKFLPLIKESSRYFVISGGRGSGKSFSVALFLLLLLFEKGHVILFSRYTMKSAELSVIPEFTSKIEFLGLTEFFHITKKEIINKLTNSRIIFSGIKVGSKDQTANLKSIEGLTTFVLDEAEELNDYKKFKDITNSVRKLGVQNRIILIFNPTSKAHWLYNELFLKRGIEPGQSLTKGKYTYIHTSYLDNLKHLNKDFIAEAEELKETDIEAYKHTYLGTFREVAEGVIFNYKISPFPKDTSVEYGLDWGFSQDPTALIKVYIDHKVKEIYLKQVIYQTGLVPSELSQLIKSKIKDNSLIIADSARPDLIEEIKRKSINIKGGKKTKIVEGIQIMKDYTIFIDPNSKDLINEFNNYCWDKNYDDRPIDDFNHGIDAIRYLVTYRHKIRKIKRYRLR